MAAGVLVLLATGCSGPDRTTGAPAASSSTTATPDATTALRERCLSAMPAEAPLEAVTVASSGGETECTAEQDADPLHEVAAAVDVARGEYGADRVVLLGTSMGGSLTVMAAAAGADVDAWADVSGPPAWEGVELAPLAGSLPDEGLVVMAPTDGEQIFEAAESLAGAAGVRFVAGRSGHGWDLLVDPVSGSATRIGKRLLAFAEGPSGT